MYTHVVLFHVAEGVAPETVAGILRGLMGNVPSLTGLEVGLDDSPSPRSADLCLITRFADRAGYDAYAVHPYHLDVLAQLKPLLAGAKKVDWAG